MNEVWTEEQAKSWSGSLARMRRCYRITKRLRWFCGFWVLYYPFAFSFNVIVRFEHFGWFLSLDLVMFVVFCWLYRRERRQERLWIEAINHGQRMFVETREMIEWHSHKLEKVLAQLDKEILKLW